jgi:hypothetical protein
MTQIVHVRTLARPGTDDVASECTLALPGACGGFESTIPKGQYGAGSVIEPALGCRRYLMCAAARAATSRTSNNFSNPE